ncbi:TIGR03885 family FMN-dependent LLM class oxidoreductase [Iningainema tapete]|uniref:TIGR03885 family FMN-dependent LLM class oxidoreductase n=1 Tax=Iningainema tapete BLCC-T55 TaxID=2748662 RepID=A0A8J7BZD4_9CYAN|nr:TIGR03885 family FMN-dependent LLM class oxidoreductase [Iningainema tapete]MBD2775638.1 TIGR03885 family FMN-dependent LLM class oxidoreductase [Iningainema tapete BLCC-T55]
MTKFGYHVSHEQFKPSTLLEYVQLAEQAGFTHALSSDHFYPWSELQGQSGFAWSWLGAALQATNLTFGVVNAPGQRYHPAIIAQAAATLAEMFPGRFWVALGSGQALNEHITGGRWPIKAERNARLQECVEIIRALWAGETVTHHGLVCVESAKLYTRPQTPPQIIGAAITTETAEWVGSWADGLITVSCPPQKLRLVVEAFQRGGGEGKPMYLKVQLSYAANEEEARFEAYQQWRTNIFNNVMMTELQTPQQFDAAAEFVKLEDLDNAVRISANTGQHIEWLQKDVELGFSEIILHNVNTQQQKFIEVFGEKVLPAIAHRVNL